jgi:hypothetical protein
LLHGLDLVAHGLQRSNNQEQPTAMTVRHNGSVGSTGHSGRAGWLRQRVRETLFPLSRNLAHKHRFQFRALFVNSQRTRWASCSATKNLSLNTKLLFLSPELVPYVLIHELCHTIHMNHTKVFWQLVACHEPGYRLLDCLDQFHREQQTKAEEPEVQSQPVAPVHLRADGLHVFRKSRRPRLRSRLGTPNRPLGKIGLRAHGHNPSYLWMALDTTAVAESKLSANAR